MNLLPLSCTGGRVVLAGQATQPPPEMQLPDGEFTLGLRPEYTYVSDPRQPGAVLAQVEKVQAVGTGQLLTARVGQHRGRARISLEQDLPAPGAAVGLALLGRHSAEERGVGEEGVSTCRPGG